MQIEIVGLSKLLNAFSKAKVEMPSQFRDAMRDSVLAIKQDAQRLVPIDTNQLRNSIHETIDTSPLVGKVIVGQPYGKYVEYGTRPHWTAEANVAAWAARHGIPPRMVVLAIAKHGTKPQPFMAPAFIKNVEAVRARFRRAISEVLALFK